MVVLLALVGCATSPERLGLTRAQWASFTPAQRGRAMIRYRELQVTNFGGRLAKDRQDEHSPDRVNVRLQGGTVLMPADFKPYTYQTLNFDLRAGRCQSLPVKAKKGPRKTMLRACYGKHILYLDPSRYDWSKRRGSVHFYYTPLWRRGQTYPGINTSGYVRFSQANLRIRSLPQ